MPRTSVLLAKDWRAERLEQSSANPERSVDFEPVSVSAGGGGVGVNVAGEDFDFASDSSESSFAEGGGSCDSGADDVIDDDVDSDSAIEVILHRRSRNLGGKHSISPQLMDLCLAGIDCWGSFFTSFRPFEKKNASNLSLLKEVSRTTSTCGLFYLCTKGITKPRICVTTPILQCWSALASGGGAREA